MSRDNLGETQVFTTPTISPIQLPYPKVGKVAEMKWKREEKMAIALLGGNKRKGVLRKNIGVFACLHSGRKKMGTCCI